MRQIDLIGQNARFVESMEEANPGYFEQLSQGQQPLMMMLACSDSRVCPSVVTQAPLGTMFVHRNIANQVVKGDASFDAGLYFALTTLGVKRIVIKGHTGCGGLAAAAAPEAASSPVLEDWLKHVREGLGDQIGQPVDDLARANVLAQVRRLKEHPVFREHGHGVTIEGYLLHLESGRLERLALEQGRSSS